MRLPERFSYLFWDCDLSLLDSHEHSSFVLSRLMFRMEEFVTAWLRQTYPSDMLLAYLHNDGARKLGPRELDYWCATLGVDESLRHQWRTAAEARVRAEVIPPA